MPYGIVWDCVIVWCDVMYCCGIVCNVVLLGYYAIVGVVYFGVWFSDVWCGVLCGVV